MRRFCPTKYILVLIIVCLTFSLQTHSASAELVAIKRFTIQVNDQYGRTTPGAQVIIRDKASYSDAHRYVTDSLGQIKVYLDPTSWYVVEVNYNEYGSAEIWCYGYVQTSDWQPQPFKIFSRQDPWLDRVNLPESIYLTQGPVDIQVSVQHAYTRMNYDLWVRVRVFIDDDMEPPYLDEHVSDAEVFRDGLSPFHLTFTPASAGNLHFRFRVERKWEENDWVVADDAGWQWATEVLAMPTVAPEPIRTVPPPPTVTPTMSPMPTVQESLILMLPLICDF